MHYERFAGLVPHPPNPRNIFSYAQCYFSALLFGGKLFSSGYYCMLATSLILIGNYLLVLGSILLFASPFYLLYHRRNYDKDAPLNWNKRLENFFLSKQANYLVFFWALGEALVWFVIPEFLLLLIVFMRIRRKRELLVYDVTGTVLGTVIAFFLHPSHAFIAGLPYIQTHMVDQTIEWYHRLGVWGLLYQPFSGVPFKVFTLSAADFHFFLPYFVIVAVLVRMSRYMITFGLFVAIYPGISKHVRKNYIKLALVATFIFSLLLLKVYRAYM